MVFVYILQSLADNGYYIGIGKNVNKRLAQHNRGKVRSTRNRKPLKVVYTEEYDTYFIARKREIELKSFKGGNKFKELIRV